MARAARQLAAAARAAGCLPIVADLFGDSDTRTAAHDFIKLTPGPAWRIDRVELLAACAALSARQGPMPLVWGSGFEDQPELLATLADAHEVLGCSPATLVALGDPFGCAATFRELDIPHPAVQRGGARRPAGPWLWKRRGAAGGGHVRDAICCDIADERDYLQQFVAGRSLSAAFVATPAGARLLGFSAHLRLQCDPATPFRYGGALGGITLPRPLAARVETWGQSLARHYALRGLCGIDFVLDEAGELTLLELNPRPTATFDLLVPAGAAFAAHLAACRAGRLSPLVPLPGFRAQGICYATDPIRLPKPLDWPDWVADRPLAESSLAAGAPVCTISACGVDEAAVARLLTGRYQALWRWLGVPPPGGSE